MLILESHHAHGSPGIKMNEHSMPVKFPNSLVIYSAVNGDWWKISSFVLKNKTKNQ